MRRAYQATAASGLVLTLTLLIQLTGLSQVYARWVEGIVRGLSCRFRNVQLRLNYKTYFLSGITPRGMSRLLRAFPSPFIRPLSHKVNNTSITAPHFPLHPRSVSSPSTHATTARMASTKPFSVAVKARRTYYALDSSSPIPDARIQEIVSHAILHVPSAFNSQTSRVVILLNDEHKKCWDLIAEVYKQQLSAEKFEHANQRFQGFRKGYGTVSVSVVLCCMGSLMEENWERQGNMKRRNMH